MPLTFRAPAKINLYLRVFPVAADGFHPLRSWFRTIDLFDELTVTASDGLAPGELDLQASDPGLPLDGSNLIRRAWLLFSSRFKAPDGASMHLTKRIPLGAGLGGGSSDAAIALKLAARLAACEPEPAPADLVSLASELGADVPFFLRHQLDGITDATCTGRGDRVQPFEPGRRHAVLLILPELHVSTPDVYRKFDTLPAPAPDEVPDFAAWSHLPAAELLPRLRNDLEAPALLLHPELARLRRDAENRLGRPVRMTGSGSALFTIFDPSDPAAAEAARRLEPLGVRQMLV